MTTVRAILYGTLAVGVFDGLDAVVFWGLRGAPASRVFQGVAAGLLGRDVARAGGTPTALLGLGIHFFVACAVFMTYLMASGKVGLLARRPFLCGPLYGLLVYLVMYRVVMPLSAIGLVPQSPPMMWNGIFAHVVCVGLPAALVASYARHGADAGTALSAGIGRG